MLAGVVAVFLKIFTLGGLYPGPIIGITVQALALALGGADALVVETMYDLTEATAAVRAAKNTGLLVAASMTYDSGKENTCTMMGVTPEQAVNVLGEAGADILGCNCGIGIDNYVKVAAMLRAATDKPVWVKANAGMPELEGGEVVYKMKPEEFAEKSKRLLARAPISWAGAAARVRSSS